MPAAAMNVSEILINFNSKEYVPVRENTNNLVFRPGPIQTSLYSHRSSLETRNFWFRKKDCTICVAKKGYCEADLRLCFRICKLLVFSCDGSICVVQMFSYIIII